jgi:hypothetical protein
MTQCFFDSDVVGLNGNLKYQDILFHLTLLLQIRHYLPSAKARRSEDDWLWGMGERHYLCLWAANMYDVGRLLFI